jgi:uncharacterized protein (DUF1778 family)
MVGMSAKTQLNVRLDPDLATAARQAADLRHLSLQKYIEQLVRDDTDPVKAAFMDSAQQVVDELGTFIEERASAPSH